MTISTSVSTIFLRLVGFGAHTVVRSETAQYLPPISLGQPGAGQGSAMSSGCLGLTTYCSNPASGLGSNGNYYFERQEGWGNPRSEGDPFDPSPAQSANTCGPTASDGCGASAAPDYHPISAEAGTATPDATLNYQGGSNYLITIPPTKTTDVQIFNPAFAPDTCGGTEPFYCYHENDTAFSGQSAPYTAYSAMEYTLFKVTTISSRLTDQKISQEIFYPYNASCVSVTTATAACPTPQSYSYFPHAQATPTAVTVAAASGPSTPPVGLGNPVRSDRRLRPGAVQRPDQHARRWHLPHRSVGNRPGVLPPRGRFLDVEWQPSLPGQLGSVREPDDGNEYSVRSA